MALKSSRHAASKTNQKKEPFEEPESYSGIGDVIDAVEEIFTGENPAKKLRSPK